MYPRLLHIYGPFWIQSYGVMIVLGFLIFFICTFYNKKRKTIINDEVFFNTLLLGLISGLIGGRTLYVFYEWDSFNNWIDIFSVWQGGFVVLGTILAEVLVLPIYLRYHKVSALRFLDFIAIYAPLMHSITRLGCLFSGCCYGADCASLRLGIVFTNPDGLAPLNTCLHPTQLYAALMSFLIFLTLFSLQNVLIKRGQLLFAFLSLECTSRFLIDFYRGDRGDLIEFYIFNHVVNLSSVQIWSLGVLVFSLVTFFVVIPFIKNK